MSSHAQLLLQIKDLKKTVAMFERNIDKQVNPPISIVNVDFKELYEKADAELKKFKILPLTGRRLYRKEK